MISETDDGSLAIRAADGRLILTPVVTLGGETELQITVARSDVAESTPISQGDLCVHTAKAGEAQRTCPCTSRSRPLPPCLVPSRSGG